MVAAIKPFRSLLWLEFLNLLPIGTTKMVDGAWTKLYWDIGNGWEIVPSSAFSSTPTTTTIAPYINAPNNVVVTDTGTGFNITWDQPESYGVEVERYAIMWTTGDNPGWGISTGNVGDPNALLTNIFISNDLLGSTGGLDSNYEFKIRADNDTFGIYSQYSEPQYAFAAAPTTTTTTSTTTSTTSTTTTTTTTTSTSTTLAPSVSTTLAPQTTTTTTLLIPVTASATTTTPATTTSTTTSTTIAPTTTTIAPTTTTILVPIVNLEEKISQEEATYLATNSKVLQEISKEEAEKIFESIDTNEITEEQKSEIIEAVQDAPLEVKEAFEDEINIYGDGFDDYVPVGSNIDVGTRRTLLAATTVLASSTVLGAAGGSSGPLNSSPSNSGGPSSSGSSGPSNVEAARKEEEKEDEEENEVEIEGPEGDEEENNFTKNSIYKYTEGTMEKRFSPLGFIKKFARETAALAFTISGTVIVFATLSGETRRITIIATSIAFAVHYLNAMLKNDE